MLTLAGQFQPYQVVDVHPKVSGYMKQINVDIGDIVHQGQTLAVLEVPELNAQLQQTVFAADQSREQITQAQHEIDRAVATHAALHCFLRAPAGSRQGTSRSDCPAGTRRCAGQGSVVGSAGGRGQGRHWPQPSSTPELAESDNQRVQALHNYTTVQAPIAGVVVWRYADTGALIQGGTNSNSQDLPIVRLSQSSLLRLRVPVPESDIRYIHDGDQLNVRVDAIGRSFIGKIVRFTRDVNFETRTMETEVDVENRDLSIAPGMYANTMLRLAHVQNVVTIPIEALVLSGSQRVVYVVDDANHVHVQPVQVGIEGSKLAEIKSGLNAGDRVIVGGQDKYQENEEISPELESTQASETVQETGGMIDLKGEEDIADEPGPRTSR